MSVFSGALLRSTERDLFIRELEKDLQFLQIFMLMMNRACPIRNVDLVWTESGPPGRSGWRHLGIDEALGSPCSRLFPCASGNPHPRFCSIINDHGLRESESCSMSDKAAEQRVSQTGKAEVYRCHFGLTDIAVPVISNGTHIATLFSGQVLNAPPTKEDFVIITENVSHLSYVSLYELRQAYWSAAVVSDEDIQNTVRILEVFAEYLAVSWERLCKAVQLERQRFREMEIHRKEFAYLVLTGSPGELSEARATLARTGLRHCPNRALVAQWETPDGSSRVDLDRDVTAVLHTIDEICERLDYVVHASIRGRGVCIFLHERPGSRRQSGRLNAVELAQTILHAISERCDLRVRIGIGDVKTEFARLGESYHEANIALSTTQASIATYRASAEPECETTVLAAQIPELLMARRFDDARISFHSLPFSVERQFGTNLAAARRIFLSTLSSMVAAGQRLGCDPKSANELRTEAGASLARAGNSFDLQEAYSRLGESILGEIRQTYFDKGSRLVDRACRSIERNIAEGTEIKQSSLAQLLGVSTSHLSRVFRRVTGDTFERHVVQLRVERARRLLLDPAHNVSSVALQCGFKDASYFARVFRKTVGCSPAEYSRRPTLELSERQTDPATEDLPTISQPSP